MKARRSSGLMFSALAHYPLDFLQGMLDQVGFGRTKLYQETRALSVGQATPNAKGVLRAARQLGRKPPAAQRQAVSEAPL